MLNKKRPALPNSSAARSVSRTGLDWNKLFQLVGDSVHPVSLQIFYFLFFIYLLLLFFFWGGGILCFCLLVVLLFCKLHVGHLKMGTGWGWASINDQYALLVSRVSKFPNFHVRCHTWCEYLCLVLPAYTTPVIHYIENLYGSNTPLYLYLVLCVCVCVVFFWGGGVGGIQPQTCQPKGYKSHPTLFSYFNQPINDHKLASPRIKSEQLQCS